MFVTLSPTYMQIARAHAKRQIGERINYIGCSEGAISETQPV